jgi:hypothetical protein
MACSSVSRASLGQMRAAIATKASGLFFATLRTACKPSSAQTRANGWFSSRIAALARRPSGRFADFSEPPPRDNRLRHGRRPTLRSSVGDRRPQPGFSRIIQATRMLALMAFGLLPWSAPLSLRQSDGFPLPSSPSLSRPCLRARARPGAVWLRLWWADLPVWRPIP